MIFVQNRYPKVVNEILHNPQWQVIDAVKHHRVYLMPDYAKARGYPMPEAVGIGELWMAKNSIRKNSTILTCKRPLTTGINVFTVLTIRAYSDANTGCGSLRVVWPQLMAAFQADAVCDFGPAGLLRERIEAGEACDFLLRRTGASAGAAGKRAGAAGRAFTTNRLCLSVRAQAMREGEDWLSLLTRRDLRIGTSTAGCDPSGDYTQQLFRGWARRAKRSENAR